MSRPGCCRLRPGIVTVGGPRRKGFGLKRLEEGRRCAGGATVRLLPLAFAVVVLAVCLAPAGASASRSRASARTSRTFSTALNYAIRFYPRFMTYFQQGFSGLNRLSGPASMGPEYGIVVAPNDDTVYGEFVLNVSKQPEVLTIPSARVTYSILTVDVWGNVINTGIPSQTPGTYVLVPRGWHGSLPPSATKITMPYAQTEWIIRADKFASTGQNTTVEANVFRDNLRLTSLSEYRSNPSAGRTLVAPLALFAPRMKAITDQAITQTPTLFFTELQAAMHSSSTTPLSTSDRALSRAFDQDFAAAKRSAARGNYRPMAQIAGGAHAAHGLIINNWISHVGSTRWVYFGNIGRWGTAYLDRASVAEYVEFGNNASAATYYDAFTDVRGVPLNSSVTKTYRLTFTKSEIPQARRFWSLTAYIPPGVTLVPNSANKYVVGSYTPGLLRSRDGSITIYIQHNPPPRPLMANWLPTPNGPFSLLLRVYGPEGNTTPGTYTPPPIKPYGIF